MDFSSPDWEPPQLIVFDTSPLVEAFVSSQPKNAQWTLFLDRLIEAGTLFVFNSLVEAELYDAFFNLAIRERWGRHGAHGAARYDGRVRRRASRLFNDAHKNWMELREAADTVFIEINEVIATVPKLIQTYGLRSNDAIHTATALATQVGIIATTDRGFARLPAKSLEIVTDRSRVKAMRELRKALAAKQRQRS